jgi:hypothetical protein
MDAVEWLIMTAVVVAWTALLAPFAVAVVGDLARFRLIN